MYGSSCPHVTNPNQFWVVGKSKASPNKLRIMGKKSNFINQYIYIYRVVGKSKASPNKLRTMGKKCNFINKKIYIYIYKTETYKATTIFHVSKY